MRNRNFIRELDELLKKHNFFLESYTDHIHKDKITIKLEKGVRPLD